ncbi:MAG TPA: carboxypeptidase regulatory-like domain-containing protein [Pyrinomonadaceae bacterium]|nr:carboxypeptidase regulatory-like domain-containing protein [Pyrinomonadaceae bacterium]
MAFGQSTTGSLNGTVSDPGGAIVSGASVTIKNNATGAERTATTSDNGSFNFPSLEPGEYSVSVEASGFKKSVAPRVVVEVANPAQVTMALEIGSVSEVVTVTAVQDVINSTSPTLTNVINTRQVQDLPLPTRNPLDLAGLQPGVAVTGNDNRGSSISGLRQTATNITQDGINAMDNFVKTSSLFAITSPSLNSTSEISITTGTNGSDTGRGVAQVRLVTRGGTNDFHGDIFYLNRNDYFQANNFFNNLAGTPRARQNQHFFGFAVGGPVVLPNFGEGGDHVWSGRDRSFWFFSYEGFRENFSATRNRTVLTPEARTGIFRYTGSNGVTQSVNLLTIGSANALNAVTMAQLNAMPAPNNTLVGDSLNTAGFRYNVAGKDVQDKLVMRFDQVLVERSRLGGHKFEFVLTRANFNLFPDTFNNIEAPFPGGIDVGQVSTRWLITGAVHSTFGTITNEARYGRQWSPLNFLRAAAPNNPFFTTFVSVTNFDNVQMSQGRTTTVNQFIDNMAIPKGSHTIRLGLDYQQIVADTFNDAGIHPNVTLGSNSANSNGVTASDFTLLPAGATGTAIVTRAQNVFADITGFLGSAAATFNVNSPTSGFLQGATRSRIFKQRDLALFVQDQWRARSNLTLNLGLRWDYQGVPTVPNGLAIQVSNVNDIFGVTGSPDNLFRPTAPAGVPPARATLDFVSGDTGRGLYKNDWNNFAPFVGFAYSPDFKGGFLGKLFGSQGTSSIRGGYSVSYLHDGFTVISNALGVGTTNPGLIQAANNNTPTGVLSANGVALTTPVFSLPLTDRQNILANSNNSLWAIEPNLRIPYVHQWSIGYERELTKNMAFEVRYVGNFADKVWRANNFNEVNIFENGFLQEFQNAQRNLAARGGTSFAPGCTGCVALPIFSALFNQAGLPAGQTTAAQFSNATSISNLNQNNIGTLANTLAFSTTFRANRENPALGLASNFFVANPNANGITMLGNDSMSNYHSLQAEVRRRFSRGFLFQADYTFSKALTDAPDALGNNQNDLTSFRTLRNKRLDYTRSSQDQTHRFVANGLYDLPFGNGRQWLSDSNGFVNRVIGGWTIGTIVAWQTRPPFYVASNRATFNQFNAANNPVDLVGITFEEFKQNLGVFRTPTGVYFINPNLLDIVTNPTTGAFVSSTLKPGLMAAPAPGTFGNFPRNSLNGPRYFNVDASIVKRIPITEGVRGELKTTFINLLNNPNFVYNTQNFDATNFGRITTQSGSPRVIHFTLKLTW